MDHRAVVDPMQWQRATNNGVTVMSAACPCGQFVTVTGVTTVAEANAALANAGHRH